MGGGSRVCAVVTAISLWTSGQAWATSPCPSGSGLAARQVRLLQTELMVGALSCRSNANLGLDGKYGNFAHKFSSELKVHGDALKSEFHGNTVRMDKYVTGVANASSSVSLYDAQYCEKVSPLFDAVLNVPPGQLQHFAAQRADGFAAAEAAGVAGCPKAPVTHSASVKKPAAKKATPAKAPGKQAADKTATQ